MISLATPQPSRCPNPTAKAVALAYLAFERPQLAEAERFLSDFGLHVAHRSADGTSIASLKNETHMKFSCEGKKGY